MSFKFLAIIAAVAFMATGMGLATYYVPTEDGAAILKGWLSANDVPGTVTITHYGHAAYNIALEDDSTTSFMQAVLGSILVTGADGTHTMEGLVTITFPHNGEECKSQLNVDIELGAIGEAFDKDDIETSGGIILLKYKDAINHDYMVRNEEDL